MGGSRRAGMNANVHAILQAHAAREEATQIIAQWNECLAADYPLFFSPTLRAALLSGHHSLDVLCRGCDTIARVDLRNVSRPHSTTIHEIVFRLSCRRCRGEAPFPLPVCGASQQLAVVLDLPD